MFYWPIWLIVILRWFQTRKSRLIAPDFVKFDQECVALLGLLPEKPQGFEHLWTWLARTEIGKHQTAADQLRRIGLMEVLIVET